MTVIMWFMAGLQLFEGSKTW